MACWDDVSDIEESEPSPRSDEKAGPAAWDDVSDFEESEPSPAGDEEAGPSLARMRGQRGSGRRQSFQAMCADADSVSDSGAGDINNSSSGDMPLHKYEALW